MRTRDRTPWAEAAAVAATQWGLVTTAQLRSCGVSPRMQQTARAGGRIFGEHRGVWSLGTAPTTPHAVAMAAVLAAGPGALLSHLWALWLWELGRLPTGLVDVTAPVTREGAETYELHRSRRLEPDRTFGIPVTGPARTLADCAPLLTPKQLRRAVNQAQIRKLTQPEKLMAEPRLRALVSEHGATRSVLEDLLTDLGPDLPRPRVNAMVCGVEVDFHFPDRDLVIEGDGWAFHNTRIAFEDDHERRLHLESRGQRVIAVTYAQATRPDARERPRAVVRNAR